MRPLTNRIKAMQILNINRSRQVTKTLDLPSSVHLCCLFDIWKTCKTRSADDGRLCAYTKMNFASPEPLANDNSSEETNNWNATETTASSPTSVWFSKNIVLTYTTVVVLWIVFVVGTLGNILVLVVLVWRRSGYCRSSSSSEHSATSWCWWCCCGVKVGTVGRLRCWNTRQHPGVGGAAVASK